MGSDPKSKARGDDAERVLEAVLAEAGWVRTLARRLVRDQSAADDVAQGTLMRAMERLPRIDDGLRPWLGQVARRLARRRVRTDLRRAAREEQSAMERDGSRVVAPPELLSRLEAQARVAQAVAELPDPYRAVLLMRYFEGESATEIARRTGASSATVRSQLGRGLARLRDVLASADVDGLDPPTAKGHTPAVLLLAAGAEFGPITTTTATTLMTMKLSTKVVLVGTAAAAGLLLVAGSGLLGGRVDPKDAGGTSPHLESLDLNREDRGVSLGRVDGGQAPARADLGEVTVGAAPSVPILEPLPTVTTIRARILGPTGQPVDDARLASIYATGVPRGRGNVVMSGPDGRVQLDLDDGDLRAFKGEVFPMVFRVTAEGLATAFEVTAPTWHGTTDLGDVRLAVGGQLTGLVVDGAGAPLAGARVFAAVEGQRPSTDALRRAGPERKIPRPRTESGDSGRFTLSGLNGGEVQLWLHAEGHLWTLTEPFPVTPGGTFDVGAMTVTLPAPAQRVDGVVLGPGGGPVAGAEVRWESPSSGRESVETTGRDGTFTCVPGDGRGVEFMAVDPSGRFGMSATVTARAGDTIELRLMPKRVIKIRVVDDRGEPVPDADVMAVLVDGPSVFAGGGRPIPGFKWHHTDESGTVTMEIPAERFNVSASEHGYGSTEAGPFEHSTAPEEIELLIPRENGIRGRLTFGGQPVPEARIIVGRRIDGFVPLSAGFPQRIFTSGVGGVTSEADGSFMLPVDAEWTDVSVVAFRQGLAAAEVELTLSAGEGADDVLVEMVRGGGVHGVLLAPPGVAPDSLYVAASRGDTRPIWTRPDKDGRFELTGMTPGPWRVEGRRKEPMDEIFSVANRPEDKDFGWNVEILDGEMVAFDVDMREGGEVEFHGRLIIDGVAASGYQVTSELSHADSTRTLEPTATTDAEGRFHFQVPAGRVELKLEGTLPGGQRLVVSRAIEVRGPHMDWVEGIVTGRIDEEVDVELGRVRVMRASQGSEDWEKTFFDDLGEGRIRGRVPMGSSMIQGPRGLGVVGVGWENVRAVEPLR